MNSLSKIMKEQTTEVQKEKAPEDLDHPEAPQPRRSKNSGFKDTLKRQMAEQKALLDRLQQQKEEKIRAQQCQKTRISSQP